MYVTQTDDLGFVFVFNVFVVTVCVLLAFSPGEEDICSAAGTVSRYCDHRCHKRSLLVVVFGWAQILQRHSWWSGVTSYHPAAAADSILTSTPSRTSRVLGCLSHMTRVFVPVISTSISVCDTEYHFLFKHWWICLNRVWTTQGNRESTKMANWDKLATTCYIG